MPEVINLIAELCFIAQNKETVCKSLRNEELKGEYKGSASAEGYTLKDGTALNLSDKDQKWLGLKDTFKF